MLRLFDYVNLSKTRKCEFLQDKLKASPQINILVNIATQTVFYILIINYSRAIAINYRSSNWTYYTN